ncbi:MAG: hypothetical protein JSV02_07820 [Dehalococcoidia bacterium]|nr:MAG: hypothetical protein JSV02_07820 [Dehalococcoidia bacterium]
MEQRITTIEEELKVLKSQIKAVLLDIKESLATGISYAYTPPQESNGPDVGSIECSETEPVQDSLSQRPQADLRGTDSGDRPAEQAQTDQVAKKGQPQEVDTVIPLRNRSESRVVDLLTVSVLAQWVSRAIATVGKDQVGKLVEIYDVTGNLETRMKDTILLLTDLCGDGGGQAEDAPVTDYVPTAVSIQLLIELDGLLRYRNDALESAILSQIMDKGLGGGKARYG